MGSREPLNKLKVRRVPYRMYVRESVGWFVASLN